MKCVAEFVEVGKSNPSKLLAFLYNAMSNLDGVEVSWACEAARETLDPAAMAPALARIALEHPNSYAREEAASQLFRCQDFFDVKNVYLEMSKQDSLGILRNHALELLDLLDVFKLTN